MTTMFNDKDITDVDQLEPILAAAEVFALGFHGTPKERAQWIYERLVRFRYRTLPRRKKRLMKEYIHTVTGLSMGQIKQHIKAYRQGTQLCKEYRRYAISAVYTDADQELLAEVDNATGRLSGNLTAQFCANEFAAGNAAFIRLQRVSGATIYRMRATKRYQLRALHVGRTQATTVPIGERRKPKPDGMPGFLRVDTVHQGDLGKKKGVYHINLVDEVSQWEVLVAVEAISESFLKDVLEIAILLFPFVIQNFHSDNGGEYINYPVAGLLEKLRIKQTKSRSRQSNDNGLAETKNGWVVRKEMGHWHIRGVYAPRINTFYREHLIPYLNFHRPCYFPEHTTAKDGKVTVRYPRKSCMTPYAKLRSIKDWQRTLRPGITAEDLERQARAKTPLQAAWEKTAARDKLFSIIIEKHPDTDFPLL
jgi:transposase InsO family protein